MSLTTKHPRYEYIDLEDNEIRLLTLAAGTKEDCMTLRLQTSNINNVPAYDALSYCWGDPTVQFRCICVDGAQRYHMSLINGLWNGLRQLRNLNEHLTLWVDQICLNQEIDNEKAKQVRRMRDEYRQAKQRLIWLGEADQDNETAYRLMREITVRLMPYVENDTPGQRDSKGKLHWPISLDSPEAPEWGSFRRFLRWPWFKRQWVFQEIISSRNAFVMCGGWRIHWNRYWMVCHAIRLFDDQHTQLARQSYMERLSDIIDTCKTAQEQVNTQSSCSPDLKEYLRLEILMKSLLHQRGTIPSDKVYAVLGLACEVDPQQF